MWPQSLSDEGFLGDTAVVGFALTCVGLWKSSLEKDAMIWIQYFDKAVCSLHCANESMNLSLLLPVKDQ